MERFKAGLGIGLMVLFGGFIGWVGLCRLRALRARRRVRRLLAGGRLALVLVLGGCGGPPPASSGADGEPAAEEPGEGTAMAAAPSPAEAGPPPGTGRCGLRLPCVSPEVGSHDLYSALKRGLEQRAGLVLSTDDPQAGCFRCVPATELFAALRAEPGSHSGALSHVYLSLRDSADRLFRDRPLDRSDEVWRELHQRCAAQLDELAGGREAPPCGLLTAYCASRPSFMAGLTAHAEQVLFTPPHDADPGHAKEQTVKLVLAIDPPGGLDVIIRFIRSRAHVRARMKAVRDICGYYEREPAARQVVHWVVDHDPVLAERAASCLRRWQASPP